MAGVEDWVRDSMERLSVHLDKLSAQMEDVRERLIRMEASQVHATVEELKSNLTVAMAKIDALESVKDQQAGNVHGTNRTIDLIIKLAPWVFATGLVVVSNWQKLFG